MGENTTGDSGSNSHGCQSSDNVEGRDGSDTRGDDGGGTVGDDDNHVVIIVVILVIPHTKATAWRCRYTLSSLWWNKSSTRGS